MVVKEFAAILSCWLSMKLLWKHESVWFITGRICIALCPSQRLNQRSIPCFCHSTTNSFILLPLEIILYQPKPLI